MNKLAHIDTSAYRQVASRHTSHGHPSRGNGNKGDQNYQATIAESAKLEQIPSAVVPTHVEHLQGSIAKYSADYQNGYIEVMLSTISGTYPLVPRTFNHVLAGAPDAEQDLIADLISVQTQNDMQNDIPTCTIILGNTHDWSSLLAVNDLIRIDYITPTYDDPANPPDTQRDRCIYTGLISNLTRNMDENGNQETYTIVGQGMAKIMSNIQLSTFSELQSNLNGYQLLPDDEKTGIGFKQHTSANIIKQIINKFVLQNQGGVNTYDYLAVQQGQDITQRDSAVKDGKINDLMGQPMTMDQYQAYMNWLADNSASDKGDGGNNNGDNENQDQDNQNQQQNPAPNEPQAPNLNIPLMVDANGELPIQNLIEFYIYENLDESYPDAGPSNPFINYNGSILQMIKDVSAKPFNEMYWTHNRGLATFNYRPTPFDPENWYGLNITEIAPSFITDINVTDNDQEQAAVFKLTPTQGLGIAQYDGGFTGDLAPLTNLALVHRYGYKLMEANVDYFNGNKQEDPLAQAQAATNAADSEALKGYTPEEARLKAPPYTSIADAFYYTSGRKASPNAGLSIPKEAGGQEGYDVIARFLRTSKSPVDFANNVAGLGIDQATANQLWTERNGFNPTKYTSVIMPNYVGTSTSLSKGSKYLNSYDRMKQHPKHAASELISELGYTLGPKQAYQLVEDALANNGEPTEAEYNDVLNNIPFDAQEDGVNGSPSSGQQSVPFLFLRYTQKLFDWYADNAKFYSGTLTLCGFPDDFACFIGERIEFYDDQNAAWYEFYCEGVNVNWSYTGGLQVVLDLTRGVALDSEYGYGKRFNEDYDPTINGTIGPNNQPQDGNIWGFWGQSVPFRGGYFGEQNLATAIANASKGGGGDSGSTSDVVKFAEEVMGKHWIYSEGDRTDFGSIGNPKEGGHADCSSFGWYCYKSCGYDVGDQAFTTYSCGGVMDKVDKGDSKAGDAAVTTDHFSIMEEKWHGMDTKIIDMNAGENIAEEPFKQGFGNRSEDSVTIYRAKGGGGGSSSSNSDSDNS